jgi:hypothetical protein
LYQRYAITIQPNPPTQTTVSVTLQFSGGKLVGPATITAREGDAISLTVTSDKADELHLHGYDLELTLRPGEPATLKFAATHTGRFTYELHHADIELGTLEVYPR